MGSIDPIFVFKQEFGRSETEAIVFALVQHKPLWNNLRDETCLNTLIRELPRQKEFWKAAPLYLHLAGIDPRQPITADVLERIAGSMNASGKTELPERNLAAIPPERVAPAAACLLLERQRQTGWDQTLQKFNLQTISTNGILNGWGSIFSVVYYLCEDKVELLADLSRLKSESGVKLAAFILAGNGRLSVADAPETSEWFEAIPRSAFINVLNAMSTLDNQTVLRDIAEAYLNSHPVADDSQHAVSTNELMDKIALYKDHAVIAHLAGDETLALDYSTRAYQLGEALNRSLESLKNGLSKKLSGEAAGENILTEKLIDPESPAGKALQIQTLLVSDEESARQLAKSLYQEMKTAGNIQERFTGVAGSLPLSPLQLVNLFVDAGLVPEAAEIADKLIEAQPMNAELLKLTAELAYRYGDYQKAGQHFGHLEVCRELIREEKAHLADSLEKMGRWQEALAVWRGINPVSLEDFQKIAICCFKNGDENYFKDVVKASANFYTSDGLFQILAAHFLLKDGHPQEAQALVEQALTNPKRDIFSIQFLVEFLIDSGQYRKAADYLASLSSIEAELPEILVKRCEVSRLLSDGEGCRMILEKAAEQGAIRDLNTLECLLDACYIIGGQEIAQSLLASNEVHWPLAPRIQYFEARSLVENGNYSAGRSILEKLIVREQPEEEWLAYYGLAIMERDFNDFPMSARNLRQPLAPSETLANEKVFEQFPDNLFLQVIAAELDPRERLARYQNILSGKDVHLNPDLWRVYAGLGSYYFQNQQYDLAVVNFREAAKSRPQNKLINLFLIEAFSRMGLFDDALEIFGFCLKNCSLELSDVMEINASLGSAPQWLKVLEGAVVNDPQNRVLKYGLAQLYVEQNQADKALRLIHGVIMDASSCPEDGLISAQLLILAGLTEDAVSILEQFLTENEALSDADILSCAFLYTQMGEGARALNLVNLLNRMDFASLALKSQLYRSNGFPKEAQAAGRLAIESFEKNTAAETVTPNRWIQPPQVWADALRDPISLYTNSINTHLSGGDLNGALNEVRQCLARFDENLRIKTLAMNLGMVTGDGPFIESLLDQLPEKFSLDGMDEDVCVWGEAALKLGREIQAAGLLSQCLEVLPSSPRVKSLQARMLMRNGNASDAQSFFEDVLVGIQAIDPEGRQSQHEQRLWLAEAALELGRCETCLQVCEGMRGRIGLTEPLAAAFLQAFARLAYDNWVNRQLQSTTHVINFTAADMTMLEDIRQWSADQGSHSGLHSLLREIAIWLGEPAEDFRAILADPAANPCAELVACFNLEGSNKAEILLEKYREDQQIPLVFSILAKDKAPEKSLQHLTGLMRKGINQPQHYAALALLKQKLNQPEDAYAAINLALSAWPDEYKWHLLAGEMSKAAGDLHTSLNHFQKAAEINKSGEPQAYLGELNLQAGNYLGISFLESKLHGNEQDFGTLLQLGKLSIKNNKPQKAVRYLENARKMRANDHRPYVLLSQVALQVGNLKKAQEHLEVAYLIAPEDAQVVRQKAAILKQSAGTQSALDYLDQAVHSNGKPKAEIAILKAGYIAELQGDVPALDFLKSQQNGSVDAAIQLEIARYNLKLGKLDEVETNAEAALQANPADPYPLEVMAKAAHQSGDLDKAVDLLIKAVQVNPFEPVFYMDIAKIYQARRDTLQAADILQTGIRSNPYNFELLNDLGLLYYQQGAYKNAELCLRQAAALRPEDENLKRMLSTLKNANIIQAEETTHSAAFED